MSISHSILATDIAALLYRMSYFRMHTQCPKRMFDKSKCIASAAATTSP